MPPLGFSVTGDPPFCPPKNQVIPHKILRTPPPPRRKMMTGPLTRETIFHEVSGVVDRP